eukprot:TRINITY_DN35198_c0_g1_i1.p1 TRINITY_DN35198_c0_g1~~TRINITY_DN35198_c0_g1_i1.p1  ORF type:complete len:186 (+),score=40.45 TRINITY_DN35198_c0_g1_i1:269-826(+)
METSSSDSEDVQPFWISHLPELSPSSPCIELPFLPGDEPAIGSKQREKENALLRLPSFTSASHCFLNGPLFADHRKLMYDIETRPHEWTPLRLPDDTPCILPSTHSNQAKKKKAAIKQRKKDPTAALRIEGSPAGGGKVSPRSKHKGEHGHVKHIMMTKREKTHKVPTAVSSPVLAHAKPSNNNN